MNRYKVQYRALFFMFLYLSNSPFFLFHSHKDDISSYEKATPCEKSKYYFSKEVKFLHNTHIVKLKEKCLLCDNHVFLPHLVHSYNFSFFYKEEIIEYSKNLNYNLFSSLLSFPNRGPPLVLYQIV